MEHEEILTQSQKWWISLKHGEQMNMLSKHELIEVSLRNINLMYNKEFGNYGIKF